MKTQLYQQPLNEALQTLAKAEIAAGNDETQREKADAARKRFKKVRSKYVELSKKLQLEQDEVAELRNRLGLSGMGGMRGGFQ